MGVICRWRVACGVWRVACGVRRVACGVWRVARGARRAAYCVCGVWRIARVAYMRVAQYACRACGVLCALACYACGARVWRRAPGGGRWTRGGARSRPPRAPSAPWRFRRAHRTRRAPVILGRLSGERMAEAVGWLYRGCGLWVGCVCGLCGWAVWVGRSHLP
eukprot:6343352-Prymnesium_polylepis.1